MHYLKITRTDDGLAIVLDAAAEQLLGAADGGQVRADISDDGQLVLTGLDMSPAARRERGRAFVQRYRKTFEALAK